MMPTDISISVEGMEEAERMLEGIAQRVQNMRPYLLGIGQLIEAEAIGSFAHEASPEGEAWTPLRPATIERTGPKMLYDEGDLQRITSRLEGDDTVVVGTNARSAAGYPYGVVHQFGTIATVTDPETGVTRQRVPARPFMPMGRDGEILPRVMRDIVEILEEGLAEGI